MKQALRACRCNRFTHTHTQTHTHTRAHTHTHRNPRTHTPDDESSTVLGMCVDTPDSALCIRLCLCLHVYHAYAFAYVHVHAPCHLCAFFQVDVFTLHPSSLRARTAAIYVVEAVKVSDTDDWMYHCPSGDTQARQETWGRVWEHLGLSHYDAALDCLAQHLKDRPSDPTALWLQEAVRCKTAADPDPEKPVWVPGKVPIISHYGL